MSQAFLADHKALRLEARPKQLHPLILTGEASVQLLTYSLLHCYMFLLNILLDDPFLRPLFLNDLPDYFFALKTLVCSNPFLKALLAVKIPGALRVGLVPACQSFHADKASFFAFPEALEVQSDFVRENLSFQAGALFWAE